MRIIAGKWRSRLLIRPNTPKTRPVPDRVREAVFDILAAHYGTPGALPGLRVADVFAGSGSMGLEALSRGAASCCFYELHREVIDALRGNLKALNVGPEGRIIHGDAWRRATATPEGAPFDLVLLDPPFRDSYDTSQRGRVPRYLGRLIAAEERYPLVVLHYRSTVRFVADTLAPWRIVDRRTYGISAVGLFAR